MWRHLSAFSCAISLHTAVVATEVATIEVDVLGNAFSVQRFEPAEPGNGEHLLLWIAPGFGTSERIYSLADRLRLRGIETWHVDLADNLFLPRSTNTLRNLDGSHVAVLVEQANRMTGRQVTLMTRSYGAVPVLHGARQWQLNNLHLTEPYLTGAILFSPELYSEIPALGLPPKYMPVTGATSIPIMLYQAGNRGNRWQLDRVIEQLESSGAAVTTRLLPGVTGVFYHEDLAEPTVRINRELAGEIPEVIRMLARIPTPLDTPQVEIAAIRNKPLDIELRPFVADFLPPPLELPDKDGKLVRRDDYLGRVTVINFWASWCPPCVEEIPALNHLRHRMAGYAFELISVNYAESAGTVSEFLRMVRVDYPVLLDETGQVSAGWNVLVYPATYVIGPDGNIAYAVNGAIHWDSDEVVSRLKELLASETANDTTR